MDHLWAVSHVFLWVLVLTEGIVLLAIMRQVGSLLLRVGSVPALDAGVGPKVGEPAPWLPDPKTFARGEPVRLTVLVFLSTHCSACDDLIPAVRAVASTYGPEVALIPVLSDSEQEIEKWERRQRIQMTTVRSPEAFTEYEVDSTPYAFVVGFENLVEARGGINHMEHLEALVRGCLTRNSDVASRVGPGEGAENVTTNA